MHNSIKKLLPLIFLLIVSYSYGQYNKEKLTRLLTGDNQRAWTVSGINVDRPEKKMTFNKNNTLIVENENSKINNSKWSLTTADNIRWFLHTGNENYEVIVSYNKKGEEYIKLKHSSKGNTDYEMKLTSIK